MKPYDYYYLAKKNLLPDAEFRNRVYGTLRKGSKVHVSAVCGKAMASVACLLEEFGAKVTGSDTAFLPPMSGVLESRGIACLAPSTENLRNIDILVVGNALTHASLEAAEANRIGIPMISGAEALAQIFTGKRSLVISGTHGKTTTSALLTHVFIKSGMSPAYMIGGVFQGSDDSYSIGGNDSKHVIYEGDEYNSAFFDRGPKFLRYNASSIILTSIEHDHVDLYPTLEDYKQAFQFLVDDLPKDGFLVMHESTKIHINTEEAKAKVLTYGPSESSDVHYKVQNVGKDGTTFSIKGESVGEIRDIFIPMFGEYNIANATAVFTLSLLEGIPEKDIVKSFSVYKGTKERQELIGVNKDNVTIIRDYAHHPTAVGLTIDALRLRYPEKRIIAIFEPRSASSKRKVFEDRYTEALSKADVVITIFPAQSHVGDDSIDVSKISNDIKASGKIAYDVEKFDEILSILKKESKSGDVALFMSSGDMEGVHYKFLS